MNLIYRIILFLLLNFTTLALGGLFTGKGVSSDWYFNLSKAPWTPPGWVFGFAWTTIMLCLSVYMAYAWTAVSNHKTLLTLYAIQLLLNFLWNPVFFYLHQSALGLLVISCLTALVGFLLVFYWKELGAKSILILPYFVWLLIATSLNGYILLKN